MWHASIAPHRITVPEFELRRVAYQQLAKVGDPNLGQWEQTTDRAFHLRRRLSDADLAELPAEHRELVDVRSWLPDQLAVLLKTELSGESPMLIRMAMAEVAS